MKKKKAMSKTKKPKKAMSKTMKKSIEPKQSKIRFKRVNFAPLDSWQKCVDKGMRYCPLTNRCRKNPQVCYNEAGIPYMLNKKGFPVAYITKYPNQNKVKYMTLKKAKSKDNADYYYRGKLIPKKKKSII